MRLAGRVAAAVAILEDFERRPVPLKTALADWARGARYAGAKDRAWISGLCLDVLRRRRSLAAAFGSPSARAGVLAALRLEWSMSAAEIAALAAEDPHGPGALTPDEERTLASLALAPSGSLGEAGDFPDWLAPSIRRAFGDDALEEMRALSERADVELRLNTLKAAPDKALAALQTVGAEAHPFLATGARIAAPRAEDRAPAVTVIPAFNKGWVEVQDSGSQIAAACAGAVAGKQVLDYCAGGGGKTLALAALMGNSGQIFAYDSDARRLSALYERARRAGLRNLQIIHPSTDRAALEALQGRMDAVFVDAPCTGAGTWRRHPDSKWRLTPQQLERRLDEQNRVLAEAAAFVRLGGRLIYVTCSFLPEENDDRIAFFREHHPDFAVADPLEGLAQSGIVSESGVEALRAFRTPGGGVQLTPRRTRSDGFYIAGLIRGAI